MEKNINIDDSIPNLQSVCILQIDNRDPNSFYLKKTMDINKKVAKYLNYDYEFISMNLEKKIHPCTNKIIEIDKFIKKKYYSIMIFVDSDAWCNDPINLSKIVDFLAKSDKNGCYSREGFMDIPWDNKLPPLMSLKKDYTNSNYKYHYWKNIGDHNNTYINSGVFILKINNYIKNMYSELITNIKMDQDYVNKWPYDQFYISDFVFKNRNNFIIFNSDILNMPDGKIIRHNWWKDEKLHKDLDFFINNNININHNANFIIDENICNDY